MNKYISFFVSSLNVGGVERAFVNLANSLVKDGHKVDFVVCQYVGELKSELSSQVNVIVFKDARLRNSVFQLSRYIKKHSIDCLITGPTYPNIVALIARFVSRRKIKLFISQHSYQDIEMKNLGIVGKIAPILIRSIYNFASKIICVSEGVTSDMVKNYNINPSKIATIYNAVIDEDFFSRSNENIPSTFPTKVFEKEYLIGVGRLSQVKNYPFMIEAFARMKHSFQDFDYNLIILGDGEEKDNIQELINRLNLQDSIFLLGAHSNPLPVFKKAKVFLHTSFSEAMPLVYVEALALNLPVVTISNNGANEILKDIKQKAIVDSHNIDEFITAIHEMLNKNFNDNHLPDLARFHSDKIKDSYLALL